MTDGTTATDATAGVLAAYRAALSASGSLTEHRLDGFDRTGIPVATAGWESPDGHAANGVGYGTTGDAAAIGALGELAEQVVMAEAVAALPVTWGSYDDLRPTAVDPVTLTLPAGSPYTPGMRRAWVPMTRHRTGEEVLVPVEFVASSGAGLPAGYEPLVTPISNGLGAGDTLDRAVGHALLELVQRDGDTVSFRALDQGVALDLAGLTDPAARRALQRLRSVGIEPVVKLASTEFATVVYVAAADTDPDAPATAIASMGEAAHPDPQVAIGKALLEYASSRARKAFAFGPAADVERLLPDYWAHELTLSVGPQEPRALETMRAWSEMPAARLRALLEPTLLHVTRTVDLAELPAGDPSRHATPADLLDLMLERLAGFDVLVATGRAGGIVTAKVLAPGLEVETLSYLRIGERVARRLLDRGSPLVGRGTPRTAAQLPLHLTPDATERLGGPVWVDRTVVDATVGELYPLYREPRRHAVQRLAALP
ncbi:YcaO-like family protein [Nakamurella deserti]|uniref:YcaO-like family protein n=1 Tax=Nakamurella deserti TaxID=2164074 RepID=UPI000DBE376E|nr:YcaO-like family protein [Nakamurella deserti]